MSFYFTERKRLDFGAGSVQSLQSHALRQSERETQDGHVWGGFQPGEYAAADAGRTETVQVRQTMNLNESRKTRRRAFLQVPLAGALAALPVAPPLATATRKDEYAPNNTKIATLINVPTVTDDH